MEFTTFLIIALAIIAYGVIAYTIHHKKWWADHIDFYGPMMALKTYKVKFFDWFTRASLFFKIYGTLGVVAVVIISVFITVITLLAVLTTLAVKPEPTGLNSIQNIVPIPGVNEFIPSTWAVWLALIIAVVVHEFGHAILCRVEKIKVDTMGVILLVIPIGFFIEPDKDELKAASSISKIRMYGAGITNNLVVGMACFFLIVFLFGALIPVSQPIVYGVFKDYPAANAGIIPGSTITGLNGIPVTSRADITSFFNETKSGDLVMITTVYNGTETNHPLVLAANPSNLTTTGFMGVSYYDGSAVIGTVNGLISPRGMLIFLVAPIIDTGGPSLKLLAYETPETQFYQVPFWGFWDLIHLLFWVSWISLNVGLFNALPMMPLDGGYMFKEAVDRLFERKGLQKYSKYVTSGMSYLMFGSLVAMIALPYLLHIHL